MNKATSSIRKVRRRECGATNLKFLAVLAVVAIVVYMGFQYVPVAYHAKAFRSSMDDTVRNAANSAMSTDNRDQWVVERVKEKAREYGFPPDIKIVPRTVEGGMEVSVKFTQPINLLPGFTYQYNFDYTAKSTGF